MKSTKMKQAVTYILVCVLTGILLTGCLVSPSSSEKSTSVTEQGKAEDAQTEEETTVPETTISEEEVALQEIQQMTDGGLYAEAMKKVNEMIKKADSPQLQERKALIQQVIDERKAALEANMDIKVDEVENVTFITPKTAIQQGLTFYPYIGIDSTHKYMFLRVGYQEPVNNNSLFVFTEVKVRTGEELTKLSFNPMNKMSNMDILGSGMTEVVDISVDKKILTLLNTNILNTEEVLVRFSDISNKTTDYVISAEQKQAIADIVEYYGYLEEEEK